MSAYAASFMVIQFDPTMRPERIIDAAHFCNVWPTETGTIGFERTIGTVKPLERSINFTGIVQHNSQTKAIGIEIAKKLKLHIHNYDNTNPHKTDIANGIAEMGPAGYGYGNEKDADAPVHRENDAIYAEGESPVPNPGFGMYNQGKN